MGNHPETREEWQAYVREMLDTSQYAFLATHGPEGIWGNPVYFAFDDRFTLYFISRPESRHMRNIAAENEVSCAVFDGLQDTQKKVRGIQLKGIARLVEPHESKHAFDTYFTPTARRTPVPPEGDALAFTTGATGWHLVAVRPSEMRVFDEHRFAGVPQAIPDDIFSL